MSTSTDTGTQQISFDYKHPAQGEDFNQILSGIIDPGVAEGGGVRRSGNLITIQPFAAIVRVPTASSSNNIAIKVRTFTNAVLDVSSTGGDVGNNIVIYALYTWSNTVNWYVSFNFRAESAGPVDGEVILATVYFSALNTASKVNTYNRTLCNVQKNLDNKYAGLLASDDINLNPNLDALNVWGDSDLPLNLFEQNGINSKNSVQLSVAASADFQLQKFDLDEFEIAYNKSIRSDIRINIGTSTPAADCVFRLTTEIYDKDDGLLGTEYGDILVADLRASTWENITLFTPIYGSNLGSGSYDDASYCKCKIETVVTSAGTGAIEIDNINTKIIHDIDKPVTNAFSDNRFVKVGSVKKDTPGNTDIYFTNETVGAVTQRQINIAQNAGGDVEVFLLDENGSEFHYAPYNIYNLEIQGNFESSIVLTNVIEDIVTKYEWFDPNGNSLFSVEDPFLGNLFFNSSTNNKEILSTYPVWQVPASGNSLTEAYQNRTYVRISIIVKSTADSGLILSARNINIVRNSEGTDPINGSNHKNLLPFTSRATYPVTSTNLVHSYRGTKPFIEVDTVTEAGAISVYSSPLIRANASDYVFHFITNPESSWDGDLRLRLTEVTRFGVETITNIDVNSTSFSSQVRHRNIPFSINPHNTEVFRINVLALNTATVGTLRFFGGAIHAITQDWGKRQIEEASDNNIVTPPGGYGMAKYKEFASSQSIGSLSGTATTYTINDTIYTPFEADIVKIQFLGTEGDSTQLFTVRYVNRSGIPITLYSAENTSGVNETSTIIFDIPVISYDSLGRGQIRINRDTNTDSVTATALGYY